MNARTPSPSGSPSSSCVLEAVVCGPLHVRPRTLCLTESRLLNTAVRHKLLAYFLHLPGTMPPVTTTRKTATTLAQFCKSDAARCSLLRRRWRAVQRRHIANLRPPKFVYARADQHDRRSCARTSRSSIPCNSRGRRLLAEFFDILAMRAAAAAATTSAWQRCSPTCPGKLCGWHGSRKAFEGRRVALSLRAHTRRCLSAARYWLLSTCLSILSTCATGIIP